MMVLQAATHARETFEHVLIRLKGDTVTTLPGRGQQQGSVDNRLMDLGDGMKAPYTAVVAVQLEEYDLHPKHLEWVAYVSTEGMPHREERDMPGNVGIGGGGGVCHFFLIFSTDGICLSIFSCMVILPAYS
jgi:hypothetical protein